MSPAGAVERIAGRIGNGRRGIRAGIARITAVCILVIAGIVACGFDEHSAACVVKINIEADRLADIAELVIVVAVDDVAVQRDLLAVEHDRRGGFADLLHRRGRIRKLTANGLIRRAGGQQNALPDTGETLRRFRPQGFAGKGEGRGRGRAVRGFPGAAGIRPGRSVRI